MTAGQPRYFTGDDVGLIIESYVDTWLAQIGVLGAFDIIIAQHWTSAFLGVRYREMTGSECPILYFSLSFGRERLRGEPPRTTSQQIRERLEPPILSKSLGFPEIATVWVFVRYCLAWSLPFLDFRRLAASEHASQLHCVWIAGTFV